MGRPGNKRLQRACMVRDMHYTYDWWWSDGTLVNMMGTPYCWCNLIKWMLQRQSQCSAHQRFRYQ